MTLIWMEPRSVRVDGTEPYRQVQHWLIDEDGRIVAKVFEPQQDNPQDSIDAYLKFGERENADFISVDHAKAWSERKALEFLEKKADDSKTATSADGVVEATSQERK